MATTIPTPSGAAGFEGLPLEMQRHILLKYFEDPCTISLHSGKVEHSLPGLDYKFGREAQIALVNKHLFNEVFLALKRSPHTVIAFHPTVSGWQIKNIDLYPTIIELGRNIQTIHTDLFFYDIGFAPYQKLAPNLRSLTRFGDRRIPFPAPDVLAFMEARRLPHIVQDSNDENIAAMVRAEFTKTLDRWTPNWRYNGATLTFSFCFAVETFWKEDAPIGTELREYGLVLTFENSEEDTIISSKYFRKCGQTDYALRVEATEENIGRMTRLSQGELDRAAEELWYLGFLPDC